MALSVAARTVGLVVASCFMVSCARPIIDNTPRTPEASPTAPLEQLWNQPQDLERRNLLSGSAPPALA